MYRIIFLDFKTYITFFKGLVVAHELDVLRHKEQKLIKHDVELDLFGFYVNTILQQLGDGVAKFS
jgi:hypothetical protein